MAKPKSKKRNGNGNGTNNANGAGNTRRKNRTARRNGMQTVNRQNAQFGLMAAQSNVRPVVQQLSVLRGSDFLTTVRVQPSPTTSGRILNELFISPSYFPGTRLTQMSQLWERYRFTSFRIRYVPAVPTTLACQLVVYFDTDPADDPTSAVDPDILIRQAVAHTGAQQWNFNSPKVIPLPMRSDDQLYYTGEIKQNVRFALQAKAYVVQVTDPLNFNGEAILDDVIAGSIYIDWVCKFQLPQINPAGFASNATGIIKTVLTSGTPATTQPNAASVELDGLQPLKEYLIIARIPTNNSALSTDAITVQPKISLREDYLSSTNIARSHSQLTNSLIANARSDSKGVVHVWVNSLQAVTPTADIQFLLYPA